MASYQPHLPPEKLPSSRSFPHLCKWKPYFFCCSDLTPWFLACSQLPTNPAASTWKTFLASTTSHFYCCGLGPSSHHLVPGTYQQSLEWVSCTCPFPVCSFPVAIRWSFKKWVQSCYSSTHIFHALMAHWECRKMSLQCPIIRPSLLFLFPHFLLDSLSLTLF